MKNEPKEICGTCKHSRQEIPFSGVFCDNTESDYYGCECEYDDSCANYEGEEEWRDIPGFEGRYQVSNLGRVKSLPRKVSNHTGKLMVKEKILKQRPDYKGYMRIDLNDNDGKHKYLGVHRLVAMAFIPNPENKPQINHIDGVKNHNFVKNLEWVTNQENHDHAVCNGLYPNQHELRERKKEKMFRRERVNGIPGKRPKVVLQIDTNTKEIIAEYPSIADAAKAIGCKTSSNIGGCCRKAYGRKTACGYEWKFREGVVS